MKNLKNFYTAGFYFESLNFCIENLPKKNYKKPFRSIIILEQLLQRGIPTTLSNYLKVQLSKYLPKNKLISNYLYLVDDNIPNWSRDLIKGNPTDISDNPAFDFYSNLNNYFKDYPFIKQLTLPECNISEFFPQYKNFKISSGSSVDFFIPCADLIIEVDGDFHKSDKSQVNKDNKRRKIFNDLGIKVFSIPTNEIRNKNKSYHLILSQINNYLKKNTLINNYKKQYLNKMSNKNDIRLDVTAIIRFQILLLELLKFQIISFDDEIWQFNIKSDFVSKINWAKLALEDFFEWIQPISELYNEKINRPKFKVNYVDLIKESKGKSIDINLNLFKRYGEKTSSNFYSINSCYLSTYKFKDEQVVKNIIKDYANMKADNKFSEPKLLLNNVNKKNALKTILKQLYGYVNFKDGQLPILEKVLMRENTLGLLPTGGGKSLCFQLSSSITFGCTIVVCPIKALMEDHKVELEQIGYNRRVYYLMGDQEPWERKLILNKLINGQIKFLFVTPERFQIPEFRKFLIKLINEKLLNKIVIDEVHCLSEWGHDFRPSYLALSNTMYSVLKINTPVISLTATASIAVLNDLKAELNLDDEDIIYRMHNSRKELNFNVAEIDNKEIKNFEVIDAMNKKSSLEETIKSFLEKGMPSSQKAGIVFTPHVNGEFGCYEVMTQINKIFPTIKTGFFSGSAPKLWDGVSIDDYKKNTQKLFKNNQLDLMCATKAFGMGINKQNVRFTLHYGMPSSMEQLYQEAGRSGRDGKYADCVVLFSREPNEIPDYIHHKNTEISALQDFSKSFSKGDFGRQMFLMTSKKESEKFEYKECMKIINMIKNNINQKQLEISGIKELYLYRVFQLGIINDWEVIDFFHGRTYNVFYDKYAFKNIEKTLIKHIKNYVLNDIELNKYISDIEELKSKQPKEKHVDVFLKFLLRWNNNNFVYNRRQQLKTLYENCCNFKNNGPKKFKMSLDEYFRVDSAILNIAKHIEDEVELCPNNLSEFLLKDGKLISVDKIQKLQFSLARYLETYQNNPWLNLLSGVCRLITGSFDDEDGETRLKNYIEASKKNNFSWENSLINLLRFIAKIDQEKKEIFSKTIEKYIDGVSQLKIVHNYLNDDYSAALFIKSMNTRLAKFI